MLVILQVLLDSVSREVYQLSGGADLVKSFHVELPSSWRNTECTAHLASAPGEGRLDQADLHVGGSDPLWTEAPHAVQYGGCGVRGRIVELPFSILTEDVDIGAERLNRSLLEVVRWRYGVFPEQGLPRDPRYPVETTLGDITEENSGCEEVERRSGGGLCPLASSYRVEAATKQNLLCRERSARRTILDQFARQETRLFAKANLTYLMPADTERLILLLEQSDRMEAHWRAVLASTFHFINSLEEGTQLAVVVFSPAATAAVHLEPTRVVGGNREGLHYRIPRRLAVAGERGAVPCLECGLAAAAQLADNTTTLVLLTSSYSGNLSISSLGYPVRHVVIGGAGVPLSGRPADSSYLVAGSSSTFPETTSRVSSTLASSVHLHPGRKFHQER
jgi:hypothetical protein